MTLTNIFVALFMLPFCFFWFILDIFEVFTRGNNMAVKSNDTAFSTSDGKARAVILTDSSGNIHATVVDSPNIYKKAVENNVVTDFYLDYNGSEYQQPLNIGGFVNVPAVAVVIVGAGFVGASFINTWYRRRRNN